MKLAKYINETLDLVDVENGHESNGNRTEEQLYLDGYKKACLYGGDAIETSWVEYPSCFVEEPVENIDESGDE